MARLSLLVAVLCAVPSLASAHALLKEPPPRSEEDGNKVGPCDTTPVADPPRTTYAPGQTIEVEFIETVDHTGSFRIAFSPDGDTGFDENVLVPEIADPNNPVPMNRKVLVTLPTTPCENCVLQLIQCMKDGGATQCSNYYSCANIRIDASAPPAPAGTLAGSTRYSVSHDGQATFMAQAPGASGSASCRRSITKTEPGCVLA